MSRLHLPRRRNVRLALAAFALGALALAGSPAGGDRVSLDRSELAGLIATTADHVTARELAGWIVEGRADYRLIDLREPEAFAADHLPGAESVPLAVFAAADLPRDEKLVLYSEGGIHAAQAWLLLKADRHPAVYSLLGGIESWRDEVLYPVLPAAGASAGQMAAAERAAHLAAFFGGAPRAAAAPGMAAIALAPPLSATAAALPVVPPPVAAAGARAPRKSKKEGC